MHFCGITLESEAKIRERFPPNDVERRGAATGAGERGNKIEGKKKGE